MRRALLGVALVALLLPVAACSGGETPAAEGPAGAVETMPPASAPEVEAPPTTGSEAGEELAGDAIRGGQLYDKWWTVLGQDPPEGEHPLWSSQSTNTRTGADTWRCKECHGWDYKGADGAYGSGSHATGFAGVMAAHDQGTAFVLGALKGDTNPDHDFSTVMDEQALTDLAVAIAEATVDDDQFVGSDKAATAGGDLAVGEDLYGTECADCHGPEGLGFNFGNVTELEYVGGLAAGNPWEFIHKMRFGQPGEDEMPSAIDNGWTDQEMLSVLTYAQSLPNSSPLTEGGQIYDNWFAATDVEPPTDDQPLWSNQSANTRSGKDTWRCKECHGWDYKGADGAYGSGSHYTGFKGIADAAGMSAAEIATWLNGTANADHVFPLGDEQVAMLTTFLQEGLIDPAQYLGGGNAAIGDPAHGEELFGSACARCHGDDGTDIAFDPDTDPYYMSKASTGNPWEFLHKVAYGDPGEKMISGLNLGWSRQDIADVLAFAQTLPAE